MRQNRDTQPDRLTGASPTRFIHDSLHRFVRASNDNLSRRIDIAHKYGSPITSYRLDNVGHLGFGQTDDCRKTVAARKEFLHFLRTQLYQFDSVAKKQYAGDDGGGERAHGQPGYGYRLDVPCHEGARRAYAGREQRDLYRDIGLESLLGIQGTHIGTQRVAYFIERAVHCGIVEQIVKHPRVLRALPRKDERDTHNTASEMGGRSPQGSSPTRAPPG